MNKLLAVYFSGTGNTEYAVEGFCKIVKAAGVDYESVSIESICDFSGKISAAETILIAYPIYGSDMPDIMKDFLNKNAAFFKGKAIITLVTQLLFSGDGAALAGRFLKKHGVKVDVLSTIHINMPSNISDLTIFKLQNGSENIKKLTAADSKINKCAKKILNGRSVKNGRRCYSWFIGFFGQRLWHKLFVANNLKRALKIDSGICVKCGKCVECCPVKNIELAEISAEPKNNCTACYRCVNLCPVKAISLFSKNKPKKQYRGVRG